MKRRVVITGAGIITAHGIGRKINWQKISTGESGIRKVQSFDTSQYRNHLGGQIQESLKVISTNIGKYKLDRTSELLVNTIKEALFVSDNLVTAKEKNILLSLGTTLGGLLAGEAAHQVILEKGLENTDPDLVRDYLAHKQAVNVLNEFELKGNYMVFADACASGTNAIGYAYHAIQNGEYDLAICGGYDVFSEFAFAGFNSLMAISPSSCRPFDKNRDGLVLGEGAGIFILEDLDFAKNREARILGEIIGYGASSDAYHITSPEPSGKSAARAIQKAWKEAGFPEIDYINAHGTGTKYNDIMEANAIHLVFGEEGKKIPVSSTKSMIGHLLGGAGAAEAVISLLAILHKILPPNLNYETPDPECALNIIAQPMETEIKTVLSNSFGFGGSNASLILKEYSH